MHIATLKPHPLTAVTGAALLAALSLPFLYIGLRLSLPAMGGVLLLSTPFLVLLVGHAFAAKTWRRNLLLALLNIPLACGWLFAVVLMWYFQPGLPGALVFGALLGAVAGVLLIFLRFIPEAPSPL